MDEELIRDLAISTLYTRIKHLEAILQAQGIDLSYKFSCEQCRHCKACSCDLNCKLNEEEDAWNCEHFNYMEW